MDLSAIRLRLTGWNLLVLGLVITVTTAAAALAEVRTSDRAVDDELRAGAGRAAVRLEHERQHGRGRDRDRGMPRDHAEPDEDDGVFEGSGLIVITSRAGDGAPRVNRRAMPEGLPHRTALDLALAGTTRFTTRQSRGEPLRVLSAPVLHEGHIIGAVQVARGLGERRRAVSRSVAVLVLTGAAGLVLAAAGSAFLSGRAMRPIGEAMERQRRFIADASHELRTPVAVLRARAELLAAEGEGLPGALRDELARLHRDAEELSTLLQELLDLARLDAADQGLDLSAVALDEVVEEVAAALGPLARERSVTLTAEAAPVWGRAHLGRLRQVLRALVDNALKHSPAGGEVVISSASAGDRAIVRVRDEGEGIAAEHLPHVFDRFYRVDEARVRGGAGLGLAIAAQLARMMRGEVSIESAPGEGTTVTVSLPSARIV